MLLLCMLALLPALLTSIQQLVDSGCRLFSLKQQWLRE
jgi:hypothetical protein